MGTGLDLWLQLTHLLFSTCHLEAGAEIVQPVPLLMPSQTLQILPQHLDDLE